MSLIANHLVSVAGFALAVVLFMRVLSERRAPSSTLAWLLAIAAVPWAGVPLYLVFGGRKVRRRAASKAPIAQDTQVRSGNQLALLPTGEQAFAAYCQLIERGERTLHVATFILGDDATGRAIVQLLIEQARRGREVRLLLDGLFHRRAPHASLAALREAGARVATFMPIWHLPFRGHANLRNHRKALIVDGRHAIVGGMNLACEYMGAVPGETAEPRWRDVSVRVSGPAVADVAAVFRADWEFATREALALSPPMPLEAPGPGGDGDDARVRVVACGPDAPLDWFYDELVTALYRATHRVWIATPYFIPDEALNLAFVLAARRGVDVRVVVPERSNHALADLAGGGYLRAIEAAGGHVLPFMPGMMHAKVGLIDDSIAFVGSANIDMRSLFLDYEIALFLDGGREIAAVAAWFADLFEGCGARLARPGRLRVAGEQLGRLLAPLV